ncbi:hypothetical protein AAVH_14317 [Aphelenchoides avenae]|nr:hypothetical protein AAVH_14317 [Aphelenchus avenae]
MDGPKVWEFRTARELEKYLVGNNVYELLAGSGLIANEMICKCGTRMYVRIVRRAWKRTNTEWGCSGNCENGYRYPFELAPTFHSWFWNFDEYRCPVEAILKLVISHLCERPKADETIELDDFQNKFLELHKEILKHEDDNIKDPLERFYAAVARKHPYDGAFVLPVLDYWEYNPIYLFD